MMRRLLVATSVLAGLAGCASDPSAPTRDAYNDYWSCASNAVRPYLGQQALTSREAALRAQADCNTAYQKYRNAQITRVRHTVASDSYDMADQLGDQQALVWRRRVTQALDDYVRQQRAGS